MVEGARLLSENTVKSCIEGSNPLRQFGCQKRILIRSPNLQNAQRSLCRSSFARPLAANVPCLGG